VNGLAIGWKAVSNPDSRKRKLVRKKREAIEMGLREILREEAFNHNRKAADLMKEFSLPRASITRRW